jgi:hypothetical protein
MKNRAGEFRCQSAAKSNLELKIRLPSSPKNALNLLTKKRFVALQGDAGAPNEKFPCSQGNSCQVGPRLPPSGMGSIQQRRAGSLGSRRNFFFLRRDS